MPFVVTVLCEGFQDSLPDALVSPRPVALVDSIPRANLWGQVSPRSSRPFDPQAAMNDLSVTDFGRRPVAIAFARKKGGDTSKLSVGEVMSCHWETRSNPELRVNG